MQTITDVLRYAHDSQLRIRSHRIADVLNTLGTKRGDRIAVLSRNSYTFLELHLGIPAHGRVIVPLNWRWTELELLYALHDAEPTVLFVDHDPGVLAHTV